MRQDLARGAQKAEDIDVELPDHFFVRAIFDRRQKTKAGIVDQHVDPAYVRHHLRHGCADRSGLLNIQADRRELYPTCLRLRHQVRAVVAHPCKDAITGLSQLQCSGHPHAGPCASDQDSLGHDVVLLSLHGLAIASQRLTCSPPDDLGAAGPSSAVISGIAPVTINEGT
nr:hypothetical protein [Paracoccus fontiphilus]